MYSELEVIACVQPVSVSVLIDTTENCSSIVRAETDVRPNITLNTQRVCQPTIVLF